MPGLPICIDASLVVQLVVNGAAESPIVALWKGWQEGEHPLVAPSLLYYEVCNALHRYVVRGELLPAEAAESLEAALGLDITLYDSLDLHLRALKLAQRLHLPAPYDAHYLATAEALEAEFWTADRRLVEAVRSDLEWVHLAR